MTDPEPDRGGGHHASPEPRALWSAGSEVTISQKDLDCVTGFQKNLLWRKHPWIDFTGRTGIRFCDQNRIAIDPDWFLIAITITIAFSKSGSDCKMKIANRF
jgi:hypothetical protein